MSIDSPRDAPSGSRDGYDSGAQQIRHRDVDIHIRDSEHHHHDVDADLNQGGEQDGG